MLVSRIGSPQVGQIGALIGGGPDDCGGGTCVLGMFSPKFCGREQIAIPIAAIPSRASDGPIKIPSSGRCNIFDILK